MSSKRISRRDFVRLMAGTAGAAALAACQPQTVIVKETVEVEKEVVKEVEKVVKETVVVDAQAGEKTQITWWHGWGGMTGVNAMQAVADAFNVQSDDIYVQRLQVDQVHQKYLTAIAGGDPPDCEIGNLNYSEFWAREVLYQMDDWIASSSVINLEDFLPAALEGAKWQGKIYGIPCIESSVRFAFSYNVALVEGAGLDPNSPPQTWDEVFDWHKAITTYDSAGNIEILGFDPMDAMGGSGPGPPDPFFWPPSYGLTWWDKATNTFHFDDDLFVEALTTINRFYADVGVEKMSGYRSSYGTWTQSPTASFPAGVQAMIVNGPWQPGELARSSPDNTFMYTWGPTPEGRRGTKFQATGGHYGSIPQGAKSPQEAFVFLEFCTTDPAQDIVFDQTGWLGPRISWNAKLDVSTYQGLDFYVDSVATADEMWPSAGCPVSSFVGDMWVNAVDAVNFGDSTPDEAAQELQRLCSEELRNQFPDLV
jgi:multiple sugar transport system substrate-binding protein